MQYGPNPTVGEFWATYPCNHGRAGIRLVQFNRILSEGPTKGLDALVQFFDKDRYPKPNDAGNYGRRLEYDDNDHRIGITNLGPQDQNWDAADGFASVKSTYNERGLEVSRSLFDGRNQPISNKQGFARQQFVYDDWGNIIETKFLDLAGNPVLHKDGYAGWRSKFDDQGNEVERTFFGIDGKPILDNKKDAGWKTIFDKRGNEIENQVFGIDGKPVLNKYGYAGWLSTLDERGNSVEDAYFGKDGKPILFKDGYAFKQLTLDDHGNFIEEKFLGVDRSPIRDKITEARAIRFTFLEGRKLSAAYFDAEDQPTMGKDGYAGWRSKFDDRGNETETTSFGVDGEPILDKVNVVASLHRKFDARGNRIKVAYLGLESKPILNNDGYAGWHAKFDDRGNQIEGRLFRYRRQADPE
jgi:YD repeat-containing protein